MYMSDTILIPASAFQNNGGWVLDTQFVSTMGMPYLLAHGLGKPVEDAVLEFSVPEDGEYAMFVYTFNWVAPWKPHYAPGVFEIYMDDRKAGSVFGAAATEWGWEEGGALSLCRMHQVSPRKLYEDHLDEFMAVLKSIPRIKKNKLVANVYE